MTNAEIVAAGRRADVDIWHWHITLVREFERLAAIDELPMNAKALAGNVGAACVDVTRWARDLERAGIVREGSARWDYPGPWFELASGAGDA